MSLNNIEIIHATCISIAGMGVLLRAPAGGGKSDLALRMIDQPGRGLGKNLMETILIADDRVAIWRNGERLMAACPKTLSGLLEVRGLGIVQLSCGSEVELGLTVDLGKDVAVDRMPDLLVNTYSLWGVSVPKIAIAPFEASAPAKLRAAVCALGQGFLSEGVSVKRHM